MAKAPPGSMPRHREVWRGTPKGAAPNSRYFFIWML